jgi:hypothetical protein
MRKPYSVPSQFAIELQASNMMAVSILDGSADPNKPVLTKENNDWDFWADEDDSFTPKNPKFFE